jgi:hypothetical protein
MAKKTRQYRAPIKRPTGKQKLLAIDVFAEKAKQQQTELIEESEKNGQSHFRYLLGSTAMVGATNIVPLSPNDLADTQIKIAILSIALGALLKINTHFYKKSDEISEQLHVLNQDQNNVTNVFNLRTANLMVLGAFAVAVTAHA